jgi:hypothetical protein
MPTKQELQAEIDRLRSELENRRVAGQPSDGSELHIGEIYNLNIGLAEITAFYEEDGMQKVRFILRPVDPFDGFTGLDDRHELLMSTPIETFHRHMKQFELDQVQRDALANRKPKRLTIRKGKRADA